MRKQMAAVLLTAIIFSVCACSEKQVSEADIPETTAGAAVAETADMNFTAELPAADYGGKVFTFLVQDDPCFRHLYDINTDEVNGDNINDAVYERNRIVEEKYGISFNDVRNAGAEKAIYNSVQAGDNEYQAVWLKVDNFFSQSIKGTLNDLYKIPHINLGKYYWDQNVVRDFTLGGKLYGIMGDLSTSVSVFTHLFGVNRILAEAYNISVDDLYDLVRNGKWTIDKMLEILSVGVYADLNGDSIRDGLDQYGFGVSPAVFEAMFSGAGEKWIEKDTEDGLILSGLTERKINVYEKILQLTSDKQTTLGTWNIGKVAGVTDTYQYVYIDKFINNTALFVDIDLGIVMDYRKTMESDFGIVPIPKYEESQTVYSVYAYPFFPLLSVPITVSGEELEMAGVILEALSEESYRKLTPTFYDLAISGKYTRDEGSVEMLDLILRSRIYDPLYFNAWSGNLRDQLSSALQKDNTDISSVYAKAEPKLSAALTEIVENFKTAE